MFLTKSWRWRNAHEWRPGNDLVFALLRNRRILVNHVRLSAARLFVPDVPDVSGAPGITIKFPGTDITAGNLAELMCVLEKFEKPKEPAQPTRKPKKHSRPKASRAEVLAAVRDLGELADEFASLVEDIAPLGIYPRLPRRAWPFGSQIQVIISSFASPD